MQIHYTYILFLFTVFLGHAQLQDFEKNYQPLQSRGQLPPSLLSSANEKTTNDLDRLNKEKGVKNRFTRQEFLVIANYELDKFIRSGRVLFNDDISVFVNKVADEVLKHNLELRNKLNIFVIKSKVANAYCFDNGTIFVTTGLMAQVDNEAQLAFIICHEAAHFVKKHSIESYVTISKRQKSFLTDADFNEYKFSQEHELEADTEGATEFSKSTYSFKGVLGAFNVLKYSHLPFDEIPFEKKFLEDSNLVLPSSYFLKNISEIDVSEDYDDAQSTHPNIKKRKYAVNNKLGEISETGRQKFIIGQKEFLYARELARFEQCRIELFNEDYATCIYDCFLLLKKYPNNIYLRSMVGKVLFLTAAKKTSPKNDYLNPTKIDFLTQNKGTTHYDHDKVSGNSKQVFSLLENLTPVQCCALALNYNLRTLKSSAVPLPQIKRMCDSLVVLLAVNNNIHASYFKQPPRKEYAEYLRKKINHEIDSINGRITKTDTVKKTSLLDLEDADTGSKTEKIEVENNKILLSALTINADSIQAAQTHAYEKYFDKFALVDHLSDTALVRNYEAAYKLNSVIDENRKKDNSFERKKVKFRGLGIDTIVIMNPFYSIYDRRNNDEDDDVQSDAKLYAYDQLLQKNATNVGLNFKYISARNLEKESTDKYNDYTIFNEWLTEFINHDYNPNTLVLTNDALQLLKEKYNTKYILWSGVVKARFEKPNIAGAFLSTFLIYPAVFTIPYLAKPKNRTLYLSVLFNVADNKIEFYETHTRTGPDSQDYLNSCIYNTMYSIKKKAKVKPKQ